MAFFGYRLMIIMPIVLIHVRKHLSVFRLKVKGAVQSMSRR